MMYEEPDLEVEKKKQIHDWLESICNPEFSLIDGLISLFIDNCSDPKMSHIILKVLKKLNEGFPSSVGQQFFNNLKFPKAII